MIFDLNRETFAIVGTGSRPQICSPKRNRLLVVDAVGSMCLGKTNQPYLQNHTVLQFQM